MVKFNKMTAVVAALVFALSPVSFAASVSAPTVNVSAQVSTILTLNVDLFSEVGTTLTDVPDNAMPFGNLIGNPSNNGATLISSKGFLAYVTAQSSGLPYTITQTASGPLASGTNTLVAGACKVTPVYSAADNGGQPLVGTLGTAGTWTGATAKTIYTSDASGSIRTVQAHYGITDTGGAGNVILPSQAAGTYTGTVVFTVTA